MNGTVTGQQQDLGDFGSVSGEDFLFHLVQDSRDELGKLMERWDKRLTAKDSLVEKYLEARLSITLKLNIFGKPHYIEFSVATDGEGAPCNNGSPSDGIDICESGNRYDRNQQGVFVHNVGIVQCAQGAVPSLVRLYVVDDQIDNIGSRSLYRSTIDGAYKFLPARLKWKSSVLTGVCNDFVGSEVERGTQIMDGVPQDGRNIFREFLDGFVSEYVMPSLIFLDAETVKISFDEVRQNGVELVDVLTGPFDL
jgi:hypothetical protein